MSSILAELHDNCIITSDAVTRLKSYIAGKSPGASVAKRAVILADAMNKVIDSRMPKLEAELYRKMKRLLLENTSKKPSFDILCSDVFQAAIELKESGDRFFNGLMDWLTENLGRELPREQVIQVVLKSHEFMRYQPEWDIRDTIAAAETAIADSLERSTQVVQKEAAVPDLKPVSEIYEDLKPYIVLGYSADAFRKTKNGRKPGYLKWTKDWRKLSSIAAAVIIFAAVIVFAVNKGSDRTTSGPEYLVASGNASDTVYDMTVLAEEDLAAGANNIGMNQTMRMKATAYDLSMASCGKLPGEPDYGITSSGSKAEVGRTVAVDPAVIPLGSRLRITFPKEYSQLDGIYVAEDTGRLIKGSSIDIFFGEDDKGSTAINEKAMDFGVRYVDVTMIGTSE